MKGNQCLWWRTDAIARTELNGRVIELFGCLFTYSLDRTKQIDRYRSISIIRNTSPSKQKQRWPHHWWPHQRWPQWWRQRQRHQQQCQGIRRNTMVGWNKKGVLFWKNWKLWRFWSRKKSSTKNHVWYKMTYNCTQLAVQSSLFTLTVCLRRGIVFQLVRRALKPLTVSTLKY